MKQSNIFITFALLCISQGIHAQNYWKKTSDQEYIYCPDKIICTQNRSIESCKLQGIDTDNWGSLSQGNVIQKGEYMFYNASSPYQMQNIAYSSGNCNYTIDGGTHTISTRSKLDDIEGNLNAQSKWSPPNNSWTFCTTSHYKDCPFAKIPRINFILESVKIKNYANNISVGLSTHPERLTLYQAWDGCFDDQFCTINIVEADDSALTPIGSFTVDMSNRMAIEQIFSFPSTGYSVTQVDETTISVKKV
jgi:hypothetical protein